MSAREVFADEYGQWRVNELDDDEIVALLKALSDEVAYRFARYEAKLEERLA